MEIKVTIIVFFPFLRFQTFYNNRLAVREAVYRIPAKQCKTKMKKLIGDPISNHKNEY